MFGIFSRIKIISCLWISLLLAILNSLTLNSVLVGIISLVIFLWSASTLIGPAAFPKKQIELQKAAGFIAIVSIIAIFVATLYYILPITQDLLIGVFVVIAAFASTIGHNAETKTPSKRFFNTHPVFLTITAIISIIGFYIWFYNIITAQIIESVRTPWEIVSPLLLISFGSIAVLILASAHLGRARNFSLILLVTLFFSAVSIAAIAYPNGFGFDPFIHRATVSHIIEFGTITPKPLYYIGQYALELSAAHIFSLPVAILDPFLVPILASLILIFSAYIGFSQILNKLPLVAVLSVFLLPLSAFIITTPQSLAYIFTTALLFLSLPKLIEKENTPASWLLVLLAIAAMVTHPLAGIPAVIYLLLFFTATAEHGYPGIKKAFTFFITVAGSISLPLVFVIQAKLANLPISFSVLNLFDLSKLSFSFFWANKFSVWLDALYLVVDNIFWIVLLLSIISLYFIVRQKTKTSIHLPILMAGILFINFWILSTTLEFDFLIEYERANYASRLIFLITLFFLPSVGVALSGIHDLLENRPKILRFSWIFLLAFLITANVYGAYPRHDNYARSAGFNVGTDDFDAVYAIDEIGESGKYVVLANQTISAAALQSFGFKTYFPGDIFYYPVPTGGELYSIFLKMVEDNPSRDYALEAMDLTGVDQAFLVVNDYWWQSDKIKERAKEEAQDWFSVGDGKVTVFIFNRDLPE